MIRNAGHPSEADQIATTVQHGRPELLEQLKARALELAFHPVGCRVVQQCLDDLPDVWGQVVSQFRGHARSMATNRHANFVMQRVAQRDAGVVAELVPHALDLCRHVYGCRVVQRVVEAQPSGWRQLVAVLVARAGELIVDGYGHFVMEHILAHHPQFRDAVCCTAMAMARYLGVNCSTPHIARVCATILRTAPEWQQEVVAALEPILLGRGCASVEALAVTNHGAALIVALVQTGAAHPTIVSRLAQLPAQSRQKRISGVLRRHAVIPQQ